MPTDGGDGSLAEDRERKARAWSSRDSDVQEKARAEAREFLGILEARVADLSASSSILNVSADAIKLDDYLRFRDLMSACWTFSILIENRIGQLHDDSVPVLIAQFDQLTVAIWSVLLKGALRFFKVIAQEDYLPLGSREIFMGELKTLYDADHLLRQERYGARVIGETLEHLEKSQQILMEIIEKAPRLLRIWR